VGIKAQEVEILFTLAPTAQAHAPKNDHAPLLAKAARIGERFRLQVKEEELYAALEQLRGASAKILSVSQIKPSLEEYFMHLVAADRAQAAAVEVSGK